MMFSSSISASYFFAYSTTPSESSSGDAHRNGASFYNLQSGSLYVYSSSKFTPAVNLLIFDSGSVSYKYANITNFLVPSGTATQDSVDSVSLNYAPAATFVSASLKAEISLPFINTFMSSSQLTASLSAGTWLVTANALTAMRVQNQNYTFLMKLVNMNNTASIYASTSTVLPPTSTLQLTDFPLSISTIIPLSVDTVVGILIGCTNANGLLKSSGSASSLNVNTNGTVTTISAVKLKL